MPHFISVLKLTGNVVWRNGSSGAFTQLQNCRSFDIATAATAQFRLQSQDSSVEIHQFEDPAALPFCPIPHKARTLLMVLNRDSSNLKKRRASLSPKSRKAAGTSGKKRKLKRTHPAIQIVESGLVGLEIKT